MRFDRLGKDATTRTDMDLPIGFRRPPKHKLAANSRDARDSLIRARALAAAAVPVRDANGAA